MTTKKRLNELIAADTETEIVSTEAMRLKARWQQGYKTGRRSACTDMALAIEHDLYLRKRISTADDPFEFLATWIREFTKGTEMENK